MTLSGQGLKILSPRRLYHTKTCLRTYFGTKHSGFYLIKRIDPRSDLRNFSRSFSQESFINYPTRLFNYVAESSVCAFTKDFFVLMHDLTGLPWWCTIAASAALMKLYSLPFSVYQIKLISRLQAVNSQMPEIAERKYLEVRAKQRQYLWTGQKTKNMHKLEVMSERKKLIEKNNCHPLKIMLSGYFEIPVWIIMSMTWRTMAYGFSDDIFSSKILISQMVAGGPFWCVNLTVPDPTYALSFLIVLGYFALVELSQAQAKLLKKNIGMLQRIMKNLFRCFGIVGGVISSFMPSTVAFFWFFSIALTLMRDLLFISPKVRRALKLPYQNYSYKDVFEEIKNKYLRKAK